MLDQRRRRWAGAVQMAYKSVVFAVMVLILKALSYSILIFTRLKLCLATAIHNFQ